MPKIKRGQIMVTAAYLYLLVHVCHLKRLYINNKRYLERYFEKEKKNFFSGRFKNNRCIIK